MHFDPVFLSTDEKERFDPTQFQESIVQGLNQTGSDLEAVAKFLDASGAKLDYRRYAETLFDILVAGGMLGKCSPCGDCVCFYINGAIEPEIVGLRFNGTILPTVF